MSRIQVGIDPGMNGGFAILIDGKIHALHKMPIFEVETVKNKKKKKVKHLDVEAIYKILEPLFKNDKPEVYVEELTHLFGLPSSSNFKLGYAVGIVHGILQTLGDFYLIHQKKWQQIWDAEDIEHEIDKKTGKVKMVKRGKSKQPKIDTKATSLNCASRIYLNSCDNFIPEGCRKPHDGCIDALLIATYGGRQ